MSRKSQKKSKIAILWIIVGKVTRKHNLLSCFCLGAEQQMCRIAAAAPCSNGLKRSSTASETESDTSAADYLPSFAFVRLVRRGQVLFFYVGGLLCLFFLKNCERSRTWYRSVFVRPSVVWLTLLLSLVARCSPTLAFASGTKDLTSSDVNLCLRHFRRCQVVKAITTGLSRLLHRTKHEPPQNIEFDETARWNHII